MKLGVIDIREDKAHGCTDSGVRPFDDKVYVLAQYRAALPG